MASTGFLREASDPSIVLSVTEPQFVAGLTDSKSSSELMKNAADVLPEYERLFQKSVAWGVALMDYALETPERTSDDIRPMIEVVRLSARLPLVDFATSRQEYRLDPDTGDLISRTQ